MAKRGRTASGDKLLARLKELDRERTAVMAGIKAAVAHVVGGEAPARTLRKTAPAPQSKAAPARKRAPMSAEARAKIAAAQKKRWAKQKKAAQ